jgi:hypothetical protein
VTARSIPGFRWEGDVPWQKWSQIFAKAFSRFSNKGLQIHLVVEVAPTGGISPQEVEETRAALKELGLIGDLKPRE